MDWWQIAINNGLAVGILVAIGGGGWRVAVFLAPLVKEFFVRQNAFFESMQVTMEKQQQILGQSGVKIDEIHRKVVAGHD